MAETTPTNVDSSIPEIWAPNSLRKLRRKSFWSQFVGAEGSGAPIITKSELLNKPGDLIHIQVTDVLTGAGQTGDTATVDGNEENLATTEIKVAPLLYRHGVRNNRRAGKKSILDLRSEARMRLEEWGRKKTDDERFALFAATSLPAPLGSETYAPNIYVVGGPNPGGAVNDVSVGDTLTTRSIQEIRLKLATQDALPVYTDDGNPYYIFVTHPNSTFQLKQEARYESWVRDAEIRGKTNPFFRGALAVIDGVIIYEHFHVPTVVNAGSQTVSKGIAFGAEFAVEGLDEDTAFAEQEFDYGHRYGLEYHWAFQPRRALEKNSTQVYVAANAVV